jgi:two-component system CheB/CheR fusion protein
LIDIDDVKRGQEEVQGALNYSQAIIETMREPLVVLNIDGSIQSVNKSFCDMFSLRVSDVKGKLLYEIDRHKWDDPKLRELLEEVLPRNNYFNDFELPYDFPETGLKTLVLNGRQIKLHGTNSPLILLVIEDITKRKKAENILKRDKETLDKMIIKRSNDLMHLQLELVRAKHLSVIGTMAATVAHELRNPLADIAISIHRIRKIIKDPLVEEILTGISSRVSESDEIIDNILKYSKKTKARCEPVKINDILRSSIDDEAQRVPAGKISIKDKIDCTKDLIIEADPVQIKEVFQNVLHNAVEAVHMDTGIIEIETNIDKFMVSILIKDNGEGISKKDLKNGASPFFTTKTKGTGLGLMVCKQLVEAHKGFLIIKSDKGMGTAVTITLPIDKKKDA